MARYSNYLQTLYFIFIDVMTKMGVHSFVSMEPRVQGQFAFAPCISIRIAFGWEPRQSCHNNSNGEGVMTEVERTRVKTNVTFETVYQRQCLPDLWREPDRDH